MGQNQSSEKSSSRTSTSHAEKDRRVNRRISIQALSSRPTPIDAAATKETARGTTTHLENNPEKLFEKISPELTSKSAKIERSNSRRQKKELPQPLPMSDPPIVGSIDIPTSSTLPTRSRPDKFPDDAYDETIRSPYEDRSYVPISHHRPPRLPLPIAEQPDSPSLGPVQKNDSDIPIFSDESGLPIRRNSMLSEATQDEEDVGEELQPFGVGYTGQTVPYTIEWNQPAEKVFVTGTFAAWDKKYRLRRSDSTSSRFKTVINLPPGTHHLKFFVDNQMVTSPDLPTAVDFNNILVNYIEISTEDIPRTTRRESTQVSHKQLPFQVSPRIDPEQTEPYSGTVTPGEERDDASFDELSPEEMPEGDFRQVTPQALLDIDLPEDDSRYKHAAQVIQDSPAPPSLPMFLSRSILNGNVPIKDDSSVLALPNHTVLNHLMTSNVRNGVLATSVTTRYKKKYVTTISFKPVPRPAPSQDPVAA